MKNKRTVATFNIKLTLYINSLACHIGGRRFSLSKRICPNYFIKSGNVVFFMKKTITWTLCSCIVFFLFGVSLHMTINVLRKTMFQSNTDCNGYLVLFVNIVFWTPTLLSITKNEKLQSRQMSVKLTTHAVCNRTSMTCIDAKTVNVWVHSKWPWINVSDQR